MVKLRNVALLIESSRADGRALLRGIGRYVCEHKEWSIFYQERALNNVAPAWLEKWHGDGIIARIESNRMAKQIAKKNLPTVDLRGRYQIEGVPVISTAPGVTSHAAAEHLLECGFKHFAHCGFGGLAFSDESRVSFVEYLAEKGYDTNVYDSPYPPGTLDTPTIESKAMLHFDDLKRWLQSLPKPVGIMACNDIRAQHIINVCRTNDIAVPEDVAIIGVDNDSVLCDLCVPSLSSIEENLRKVGYEAATLLERMMNGYQPTTSITFDEPVRLVARQSTNVLAIDDPDVRSAMLYIHQHACEGIMVSDIHKHLSISNSTLKQKFKELLGRSLKDETTRVQLQRVKELLTTTDLPLSKVAELAGFSYLDRMCKLFKKKTGQTPGRYRTSNRR